MAFGKKKEDAATPDAEDAAELDTSEDEAPEPASDAIDDESPPDDEPAAEAGAPAAAGADALLSMFQESKTETDDLGVLVDLAGETDLDDILEELRTLRAALGITDAYDDEEDFAAAA